MILAETWAHNMGRTNFIHNIQLFHNYIVMNRNRVFKQKNGIFRKRTGFLSRRQLDFLSETVAQRRRITYSGSIISSGSRTPRLQYHRSLNIRNLAMYSSLFVVPARWIFHDVPIQRTLIGLTRWMMYRVEFVSYSQTARAVHIQRYGRRLFTFSVPWSSANGWKSVA